MSNNRLKVLNMLSSVNNSDWKVGKSPELVQAVSSKLDTLPAGVFDGFYIDSANTKKISVVDFALMTYDMNPADQDALMDAYNINSITVKNILRTADDIAELMDSFSIENADIGESTSNLGKIDKSDDFDEI